MFIWLLGEDDSMASNDVEVKLGLRLSLEGFHETANLVACFHLLPVHKLLLASCHRTWLLTMSLLVNGSWLLRLYRDSRILSPEPRQAETACHRERIA